MEVVEHTVEIPPVAEEAAAVTARPRRWIRPVLALALVAAVVGGAAAIVFATRMRPAYDAYGWLVWGHQALHGNLNTDGAPSWKALTFLFTLPYSLAGRAAMQLWMVTAVAATLAGAVFAARIAYRLAGPAPGRPYAPVAAAAFAALGVLGIVGDSHLMLIAASDPMSMALCLAAIDAHLSRRPRLAFAILVLASLGRPEVWPFVLGYAIWCWWRVPGLRPPSIPSLALIPALLLIPALSFGIPALTSKSWLSAANLDLNSINALHGDKITGVIGRFFGLYERPMWIAVGVAVLIALARRNRVVLGLVGAAALWVVVEIAFAYHGFSAVPRYMIEPAAVLVAVGGAGVGWVIAGLPRFPRLSTAIGLLAAAGLVVALVPVARQRVRTVRQEIGDAHRFAAQDDSLEAVIVRLGGPARVLACGQPVTDVGHQSELAWDVGLNVGQVGYHPSKAINSGKPIVLFHSDHNGWRVRPIHSARPACAGLATNTPS